MASLINLLVQSSALQLAVSHRRAAVCRFCPPMHYTADQGSKIEVARSGDDRQGCDYGRADALIPRLL